MKTLSIISIFRFWTSLLVVLAFVIGHGAHAQENSYQQHNLVADVAGTADLIVPNSINPWEVAFNLFGPGWVTDNSIGVSTTLYNGIDTPSWAMALALAGFGEFSSPLIVGNLGDGTINAYDIATGEFVGQLSDPNGSPVQIDGLWALAFGNGFANQSFNTLFFAAGPNEELNGIYERIDIQSQPNSPGGNVNMHTDSKNSQASAGKALQENPKKFIKTLKSLVKALQEG